MLVLSDIMLLSNNPNNGSTNSESDDMQLNECHIENSLSGERYIGQDGYRFDQIYSRRRCKTKAVESLSQLNRRTMGARQQQHHRPLSVHTSNAFKTVILFFIILLSNGQITSVLGTHSRDSPNSIYRNNHNVNNVNNIESYAGTAIDNVTDTEFGLSIVDIDDSIYDTFSGNNTNGINNESERRSRRSPVYHNEFAVYIPNGAAIADSVADKHGFTNMGQVRVLSICNFSHSKSSALSFRCSISYLID